MIAFVYFLCFFFFKQKTAYEMRISDWSSDVCSSDLAVERGKRSAEHVIGGVHRRRPFERPKVGDVLDDDNDRLVAPDIGTDRAGIDRIHIAATRADLHLVIGLSHCQSERTQQLLPLLDEMQRGPPGRAGPEPRHFCQKLDEFFDFGAGDSFCHAMLLSDPPHERNRRKADVTRKFPAPLLLRRCAIRTAASCPAVSAGRRSAPASSRQPGPPPCPWPPDARRGPDPPVFRRRLP